MVPKKEGFEVAGVQSVKVEEERGGHVILVLNQKEVAQGP